jgi:hypothetical protein
MDQSLKASELLRKNVILNLNQLIQYILHLNQRNWDLNSEDWFEQLFLQYQEVEYTGKDAEEDPEYETREPYEFWVVSDYFGEFLEANQELTTKEWGFYIWGRETTGQSILLDSIFQKFIVSHNAN